VVTDALNLAIPTDIVTSDFLPTAPISAAEVSKAIKRLRPSKCVGLDGIPSLVIKVVLIFLLLC
jgi:hypothetical protein